MSENTATPIPHVSARIVREPSQERSRETLRQIVAAAQSVLARDGERAFTMAKVASEAGVSTGVLYSNFAGKAQLLLAVKDLLVDEIESSTARAMAGPFNTMEEAIHAYCSTLAELLGRMGPVMSILVLSPEEEQKERGRHAWHFTRRAYEEALAPFIHDINHPEPLRAIRFTSRTATSTLIHATSTLATDDITWRELAQELTDMSVAYLRKRKS